MGERELTLQRVVAEPIWIVACTFVKISMAFTLLRFKTSNGWRLGLYTLIVLLPLTVFSLAIAALFRCRPIEALWNPHVPNAKCRSSHKSELVCILGIQYVCLSFHSA